VRHCLRGCPEFRHLTGLARVRCQEVPSDFGGNGDSRENPAVTGTPILINTPPLPNLRPCWEKIAVGDTLLVREDQSLSEFTDSVNAIATSWRTARDTAEANPTLWKPHWPQGNLAVVDEMVSTMVALIARERAPAGFGPGYQLARHSSSTFFQPLSAN
jgi:hypothetical protein